MTASIAAIFTGLRDDTGFSTVICNTSGIVANQIIFAQCVTHTASATITPPAGFTSLDYRTSTLIASEIFWKLAAGGETSFTFTFTGTARSILAIMVMTLDTVHTTSPSDAVSGQSNGSTTVSEGPSISPTGTDDLLMWFSAQAASSGTTSTPPGSMAEQYDFMNVQLAVNKCSATMATETLSASGATGTRTGTWAATGGDVTHMLAVKSVQAAVYSTFTGTQDNLSQTTVVCTLSGILANQILIAQCSTRTTSATITGDTGFASLDKQSDTNVTSEVFWKLAAGGETTITFTYTGNNRAALAIMVINSANTTPSDAVGGQANGSGVSSAAPSISPSEANDLLLWMAATAANTTSTPPTNMTEKYDFTNATGSNKVTLSGASQALSASGATGTRTGTWAAGSNNVAHLLAVKTLAAAVTGGIIRAQFLMDGIGNMQRGMQ